MKVLIVKTSSLGDIIHTFPALVDAIRQFPQIQFDWVVEESFAQVPHFHPRVNKVIPVAIRRWRKQPLKTLLNGEWKNFKEELQKEKYDYVIDAQGLLKSAFVTFFAKGLRCGLDFKSAWEPLASLIYQYKNFVDPDQHAVVRMRQLFAKILNYTISSEIPDYGIDRYQFSNPVVTDENYILFLHGTTWETKHWPEEYWKKLAVIITDAGLSVYLPFGNEVEYARAKRIAALSSKIKILPKLNLIEMAGVLSQAKAAVAVDTGLGHLAAALAIPTISLYGATDPELTGALGKNQIHLKSTFVCAPCLQKTCHFKGNRQTEPACFEKLTPEKVWENLQKIPDFF
jgi:heptosyltransferase-1